MIDKFWACVIYSIHCGGILAIFLGILYIILFMFVEIWKIFQ